MFRVHRQQALARLCNDVMLIGGAADLPVLVRKAIEKMSSAVGIDLLFADSELAQPRLGEVCS